MTTIYWAGGEDTSFGPFVGTYSINTTASTFRSGIARAALLVGSTGSTVFPPTAYAPSPVFTPVSSFWFHCRFSNVLTSSNVTSNGANMIVFNDAAGVGRLAVQGTGNSGQLKLVSRDAAGDLTVLATTAVNAMPVATSGQPMAIDIFVNYGSSGQMALYINGVNAADTGAGANIKTDSATALAQVLLSLPSTASTNNLYSEILLQDTSTLGYAVWTNPPVASGNTQSWTPNTVSDINPTSINDANFVSTATVGAVSEWTVGTSLPAGSWAIEAVVQEARVSAGATGPQHFSWEVRTSDGTDHTAGTIAPSIGSFNNFQHMWTNNPNTGVAWNAGELINAGLVSAT